MINKIAESSVIILGKSPLFAKLIDSLNSFVLKKNSTRIFLIGNYKDNIFDNEYIEKIFKNLSLNKNVGFILVMDRKNSIKNRKKIKKIVDSKCKMLNHLEVSLVIDLVRLKEMEKNFISRSENDQNQNKLSVKKTYFNKSLKFSSISHGKNNLGNVKLNQIINHISIPAFVINNNHVITHWNRAIENITGCESFKMLGTDEHWKPFYNRKKETIVDVVLNHYSGKRNSIFCEKIWTKSKLIFESHEYEEFFSRIGKNNNKWLFFTATIIRSYSGNILGAIQTVMDITKRKKIENEHKSHITELKNKEKELAQIIQGSTIPTFIINSKHLITHWNSALEKMTGCLSKKMVGTSNQWHPFWQKPRPTMADAVLDRTGKYELEDLYGGKWRKSDLIDGGYEAELFFPKMGNEGKWLFFTAAPIKSSTGKVIGAIETLWDTTENRKSEVQRKRYTSRLEEKEREFAQIIQGSTAPTFVINKYHSITHWNHALEKLTGFRAIDMLGTSNHWKPFSFKLQPTMADVILDKYVSVKTESKHNSNWRKSSLVDGGYESEEFFEKLGDRGKWLFFTAAPIKTSYDSINAVIQTFWDLSLAKLAEKERNRYTNELAMLCSIYSVLSSEIQLNIRIQNVIEEIKKFINANDISIYMSEDNGQLSLRYSSYYIKKNIDDNLSNQPANNKEIINQVSKIKKTIVVECEINEKKYFCEKVYIPIFTKNQKELGIMQITNSEKSFSLDDMHLLDLIGNRIGITVENNRLSEELERKSKFQSKLIKSANDGIIATDNKWRPVIFNPAAEKIFGYKLKDFSENNDIREFFPQEAVNILYNSQFSSFNEDATSWIEMKIATKKKFLVPVRFSGSTLREKNEIIGSVAFFQDLREIKRLEKELVQSEKLAAVGQTVAGMAHCIKNILHGFKGGRYLMDVGTNKNNIDKIKNGWGMIQRNINRTSDLVMDLLSYSKEREPEIKPCNPNEIVDDVYQLLKNLARNNEIELKKKYSKKTSFFNLDSKIIHRCLMNLVTNAIDACLFDDSVDLIHKVIISVHMSKYGEIVFTVRDNGCGMTDEVKSKLFSSLFSTKGTRGTGLGLLVTAKLIDEHSGSIKVFSENRKGTIFKIQIPYIISEAKNNSTIQHTL